MVHHTQVPFVTIDGVEVEVDAGMLKLLIELRRLGVHTQYSCQGTDDESAYVVMNGRNAWKLLRRLRRHSMFRRNHIELEYSRFTIDRHGHHHHKLRWNFSFGPYWIERRIKLMYSRSLGLRILLDWPKEMTPEVLRLLKSTRRL